jgi:hypothetical protein
VTDLFPPGGNHYSLRVLLSYVPILPSSQVPADGSPPGLVLAPFRGVRYAEDRVSGLAEVTSPPYDVMIQQAAAVPAILARCSLLGWMAGGLYWLAAGVLPLSS